MTVEERFKKLKQKYKYDAKAAEEKIQFIETHCRHVEGDLYGSPLVLPDSFKNEILRPIFGLKRDNGKRLIRMVYIQMPRKNAKTTMMAAVELALLFNDGEPSAQIYNCAGDDQQADLLFTAAKKMIDNDKVLLKAGKTFQSSITYKDSFIKKITSKSDTKHGFNTHGWIYDELHVAKNRDLYDTLKTSMGQRSNPLGIMITTPGTDKLSICYNRYDYTKKILEGHQEDDTFWGVIYESEDGDDIYSEKTWAKANPLYNHSENLRETISAFANEVKNDVSLENTFRRLHLGQWTDSVTRWIKGELWTSLAGDVKIKDFEGERCFLGLDLSATSDLVSLCELYESNGILVPFWHIWIPGEAAAYYQKQFNIRYDLWANQGFINISSGNTIDFRSVEDKIYEIGQRARVVKMVYDEWNSRDLATRVQEKSDIETIISGQGYRLSNALKKVKEMILAGKFIHSNNPIVNWTFSNILVKENEDLNIKIVKPKDEKKIDPWVSLAMAVSEQMIDVNRESVYKSRGVISI